MKKYIHVFYDNQEPTRKLYFFRLAHKRYYAYKEALRDIYNLAKPFKTLFLGSFYQPRSLKALIEDMRVSDYTYEGKIKF